MRGLFHELRRLSGIYRPQHWVGLILGLAGCYVIYVANVNLTKSYSRPDDATSHFTFTAGCAADDACGDVRLYTYIAMPRCANPVKVFMFLTPAAASQKAWLPRGARAAFATDDAGARDFHLWAGTRFDLKQLNGGYLRWFRVSRPSDIAQTFYYGGAELLKKSLSGSGGLTGPVQADDGVQGIAGRVPASTRYLAVAYADNLVLKRSFGTCYLQIPQGQAMGIDTSISAEPLVRFADFRLAVGGPLERRERTTATYQLITDRGGQRPSLPFGLEVDPADSTVPLGGHVGGLVSWSCSPDDVDCNGGYVAVLTPSSDQTLANHTFLLGTLLGVLAGVVAAAALQFQPLPPRRNRAGS